MAQSPEPAVDDHLWTIAMARIVFGADMNIQAPPNLSGGPLSAMIGAGINDWGGVSPVTPDHVNPEKPWPALRCPGTTHVRSGQGAGGAARDLSCLHRRSRRNGSTHRCVRKCCALAMRKASRARTSGSQGPANRFLPFPRPAPAENPDPQSTSDCAASSRRHPPARRLRKATSSHCLPRAVTILTACVRRPMRCDARSTATASPMSSIATSTTPMSATTAASSAPSPKAGCPPTCAAGHMTCPSAKSNAAASRPGSAARPRSVCRVASTPTIPARPTSKSAAPSRRRRRTFTSMRSRPWRCSRARRRSA